MLKATNIHAAWERVQGDPVTATKVLFPTFCGPSPTNILTNSSLFLFLFFEKIFGLLFKLIFNNFLK